jgi:hypothetical protein
LLQSTRLELKEDDVFPPPVAVLDGLALLARRWTVEQIAVVSARKVGALACLLDVWPTDIFDF